MRSENRSNALLVELMIVILFFMLAATVLVQVFGKAHSMSARSETIAEALLDAQNVADTLYAAPDGDAALTALGFQREAEGWRLDAGGYQLSVTGAREETSGGALLTRVVRALSEGEELFALPVSRYEEARP